MNKTFQHTVRETRNKLLMMVLLPWANSAFKIKLVVASHEALVPEVAPNSLIEAGLWPMNYKFRDRFTASHCSDNTPVECALKIQTRSDSAFRQNRITRSRSESRQLLDEIRRRKSGGPSAKTALAEIQALPNDSFKVNKLLDTEVSPPKFARVAQRGLKTNAANTAAQHLRSQSGQAASSDNTNNSLHSEICMPE